MSSPYHILDNRPIDQWKVVELKEELKRRKLPIKGLKDDLVRRLDEALSIESIQTENVDEDKEERETEEKDNSDTGNVGEKIDGDYEEKENTEKDNADIEKETQQSIMTGSENAETENTVKAEDGSSGDLQGVSRTKDAERDPLFNETVEDLVQHDSEKNKKADDVVVQVNINDPLGKLDQQRCEEKSVPVDYKTTIVECAAQTETVVTDTKVLVTKTVESELVSTTQVLNQVGTLEGNDNSSIQLKNEGLKSLMGNKDSKPLIDNAGSKPQVENDGAKAQQENVELMSQPADDLCSASALNSQVSEVSHVLGLQVKSDSVSTDSVSINEKTELKDNIIADNVKIEQDFVKPEMVEPSSSNVVPAGESHPMDVEEPLAKKAYVEERPDNNSTTADSSNKIDIASAGCSEKLNLDRSSGDDSMEEDVLESKQIESKYRFDEVRNKTEKGDEETHVDVLGDGDGISTQQKGFDETKSIPVASAEKRKLCDHETPKSNEPAKRQRRWNSESIKVPEPKGSNLTSSNTPKDKSQPTLLKHNFSRSESSVSEATTPKERVVPESLKTPTNSLRIDRFLRPFTLKAVQELLGKTGTVISFWMDHIKTHCYVTYASVEEAIETRNTLYNLQWPQNGGKLLLADYVDPEEVKLRIETPATPTTPASGGTTVPKTQPILAPVPSPRQQVPRQQLPPPPSTLPPPPPLPNPPPVREQVVLPPPPPLPVKQDPPIVTLDDLFRKTTATPRIYYLPLTDEQVAAKLAARSRINKQ